MLGIIEMSLIAIAILFLVLWLGKKSPEIAKNAGESIKEFKKGMREVPVEFEKGINEK